MVAKINRKSFVPDGIETRKVFWTCLLTNTEKKFPFTHSVLIFQRDQMIK